MPKLFEVSYDQRRLLVKLGWTPEPNEAGYFPTVSEALFWIRKEKSIYAIIGMDETTYPKFCVTVKRWNGIGDFEMLHDFNYVSGKLVRHYEEAEEEGLNFILKYLKEKELY